ncbi:armadillo-type protein [Cunninghamella echinulata]|nr:armadillo-type protein [Cunninghamella echinulata]
MTPSSPAATAATQAAPVKKVDIPRKKISDFEAIQYPESVPKTPTNPTAGKIQYDPEFLLQFKPLCLESSEDLSAFQDIGEDTSSRSSSKGGMQRRQTSERGNRGPRTPTGDNMYRHGSRDGRMDSMGKFTGGRPLAHRAGSSGTPPPGSPGGGIQRDGSHGGRSRSGRGSGKGRHPPREQQGGPTIPLDQVVPLEKSENRWMPTVVATGGAATDASAAVKKDDSELIPQEVIIRKVKSLLNKLTLEKFDSISDQIWEYAHQSAKEESGESLLTVIQLIFEKACDEPPFAGMWAQLCRKLHDTMVEVNDITDVNNKFDKYGKPIQSGHLFRKYLFNRCQQAFERGWKFEVIEVEKSATGEVMMTDEYYAAVKAKRQGLGLVQFIGELFKRGMLTERIMTECLTRLCRNPQEAEDEETETMCKLVTTVGKELDHRKNMKQWMDVFFDRMKEMLECKTLSSRVKFMIMDVIELRKGKWVPRTVVQTGPTTIAQIREEAQKAKNEEKESIKRTSSSRGNTPQVMSRQGSRAGRNIQREGSSNNNAGATVTADGWSTVGNTASATTPKGRTNELANFGKADRSKSRSSVLGPSNSPFASLSRSGSKNANVDSKRGSPVDSRSSSPASSMSNMFSALGGDGSDEQIEAKPVERKKLNLLPRGSTVSSDEPSSTEENESASAEESAKPKLTEQQIEQKAKDIIEEYIHLRDPKELTQCVKELNEPLAMVNKLLAVVEKKEEDVKGACEIINTLSKENLLEKEHYVEALKPFMEMYEDLTIDVPQAPKYMTQLLVAMNVDPSEVMEIEEPYESGYVPASAKLKQLYDDAKSSA